MGGGEWGSLAVCDGWSTGLLFVYPGLCGGAMGLFFRWLVGAPLYVKYVCREIIVPLGIQQAVARKTQFLGALLQMVGHAVSPPADEIRDAAVGAWRMPPKQSGRYC